MLHAIMAGHPELAIFASLLVGYGIGLPRIGQFSLGGVAGTLIAALIIGQVGVRISPDVSRFMFLLFIYALGFSAAQPFFASVDRTTLKWVWLVAVQIAGILLVVLSATWVLHLDVGTAAGLLAGGNTESAIVGTAGDAIARLGLPQDATQILQAHVATAYGLSYVFGLITIILFTAQIGPHLLRADLRRNAQDVLERIGGADLSLDPDQRHALPGLVTRSFRVATGAGRTVAAIEAALGNQATIEIVKRHGQELPINDTSLLCTGDDVAILGRRKALASAEGTIGPELGEPQDLDFVVETRDIVLTRRDLHGIVADTVMDRLRTYGCRGVYLAGVTRMERNLPLLPGAKLRQGDVLRLFGRPLDVARAIKLLGPAQIPGIATDIIYLSAGLILGILTGMMAVPIAGADISLGSAGALLSGLLFGWLRSRWPTFGAFPPAAALVLKDIGLSVFIAAIGLGAAPSVVSLLSEYGWKLPVVAVLCMLVPAAASLFVGRYLLHMEPVVLCGAIAGQASSTPAIKAVEERAGNPVPVIGYTVTYAVANVLLPLLGPILVAILGPRL